MISLTKILNEIKLVGVVTPEMVLDLDLEVFKRRNPYTLSTDLHNKIVRYYHDLGYNINMSWDQWILNLSPQILKKIYGDLLNFKKQKEEEGYNGFFEIRMIGGNIDITPKKIVNLHQNIIISENYSEELENKLDNEIFSKYLKIDNSFSGMWKEIYQLKNNKDKLINLYHDLINFIKVNNININNKWSNEDDNYDYGASLSEIKLRGTNSDSVIGLIGHIRGKIQLITNIQNHDDLYYKLERNILKDKYQFTPGNLYNPPTLKYYVDSLSNEELRDLNRDLSLLEQEVNKYVPK